MKMCCAQGLAPSKHPINVPLRRKTKRDWRGKPGRETSQDIIAIVQKLEALNMGEKKEERTNERTQANIDISTKKIYKIENPRGQPKKLTCI